MMVEGTFSCDAMVRGYLVYKDIWVATDGEFCLFFVRELQVLSSLVCLLLDSYNLSINFKNYQRLYFRRQRPMRIQQRIINRSQILVQCHNYHTNTVTRASTCEPHPQFGYLILWFDYHPRKK